MPGQQLYLQRVGGDHLEAPDDLVLGGGDVSEGQQDQHHAHVVEEALAQPQHPGPPSPALEHQLAGAEIIIFL